PRSRPSTSARQVAHVSRVPSVLPSRHWRKHAMESTAYEELCRVFIAEQVGLAVEDVRSIKMPNPNRPNLPQFSHQIDLYCETPDQFALYLNIANAKWRASEKVDQPDVLLLQQVRTSTDSHKAFMLTNSGFTAGAIAAAQHYGIALHMVAPEPWLAG